MFSDNPNLKQLAPKIWIYKNFITGDLLDKINSISQQYIYSDKVQHEIGWYEDRQTPFIYELIEVWEKASELIYPEFVLHPQGFMLKAKEGDEGMFVHADAPGEPHECGPECGVCDINMKELVARDVWNTCCRLHYGVVVYFGDFDGGEIYYPLIKKDGTPLGNENDLPKGEELSIKPENGDLVIHGAHQDYMHGTYPITRGTRFAFSNFALPAYANPGTFFSYKSDNYNEQMKYVKASKNMKNWLTPVNNHEWVNPQGDKNGIK